MRLQSRVGNDELERVKLRHDCEDKRGSLGGSGIELHPPLVELHGQVTSEKFELGPSL